MSRKKLREPHSSIPGNPLLAEPLYLTKYIERMGTGTRDMINLCVKSGLPEPEFTLTDGFVTTIWRSSTSSKETGPDSVTDPVTDPVKRLILVIAYGELSPATIRDRLGLKHRASFRENYLRPALERNLIEPTIPDKPTSHLQKYRLTDKGRGMLEQFKNGDGV